VAYSDPWSSVAVGPWGAPPSEPANPDQAQKVTPVGGGRADAYAAAQVTVLVVHTLQQLASDTSDPW